VKKLLCALLLVVLLGSLFGAYGFAEGKAPMELEFMAWYPVQMNENDAVVDYIQDKFNVEFKLSITDWEPNIDNIAMRVASGDYPNVMLIPYYWVPALGEQYTAMIEDDLLINVSSAAEAGGYDNIVTELGRADAYNMRKVYGDENGDYFCIPRDDGLANPGIFVRKDWMDALGIESPQTLDEFEAMLEKMVAADLDGAGSVEGVTFDGSGWLEHFIAGFTGINTNGWYQDENGEWSYKVYHPQFTEALKYLNRLYTKGLIDPEFINMKISNCRDKFLSGRASAVMQNANGVDYIDFLLVPIKEYKEDADVVCLVPWPKGPSGKRNGANPYGSMAVIFKSGDEAKDAKVLEILDYILSEEGTAITTIGIEGVHYTMEDGERVVNQQQLQNDFHGIEHHFMRHFAFPGIVKDNLMPMLKENYEDIKKTGVPPEIVGMNTERTAVLEPNLKSVYDTWLVAFVTGEKDIDADFAAFLSEYEAAGYSEMLEEVKAFAAK
jgi:putative aldouronate transport system substrate-binding protein